MIQLHKMQFTCGGLSQLPVTPCRHQKYPSKECIRMWSCNAVLLRCYHVDEILFFQQVQSIMLLSFLTSVVPLLLLLSLWFFLRFSFPPLRIRAPHYQPRTKPPSVCSSPHTIHVISDYLSARLIPSTEWV